MKNLTTKVINFTKNNIAVHPILLAVFPILFLYTRNISEINIDQTYMPMLFSLAGTVVLWLLTGILTRSVLKGALAATVFIFFFYSYGRFYELLENWDVFVPSHAHLLPVFLFVFGYCVYFIKIAKRDFKNTTKILNVVAGVLILVNLGNIVFYHISKPKIAANTSVEQQSEPSSSTLNELGYMPDIYYIILDEYAHPDIMKEYFNYDNSEFISYLEDKGFYVASESIIKYAGTEASISSSLNMQYFDENYYINVQPAEKVQQKINNNEVVKFLKSKGYNYIYAGIWSEIEADIYNNFYIFRGQQGVTGEFTRILINTSLLTPFYYSLTQGTYDNSYRTATMDTIKYISELPYIEKPKFSYIHIMCPHEPFVFGSTGEQVPSYGWLNYEDKTFYLNQYIFITSQIQEAVNELLEKCDTPPVIIIQSDHGPKTLGKEAGQKILNAYYLPGVDQSCFSKDLSPINTFRLIFNLYFKTEYSLLEDK